MNYGLFFDEDDWIPTEMPKSAGQYPELWEPEAYAELALTIQRNENLRMKNERR